MVAVLFVCLGNICRSPTAEGVFRGLCESRGCGEQIRIDSAGTGDWHVGNSPEANGSRGRYVTQAKMSHYSEKDDGADPFTLVKGPEALGFFTVADEPLVPGE